MTGNGWFTLMSAYAAALQRYLAADSAPIEAQAIGLQAAEAGLSSAELVSLHKAAVTAVLATQSTDAADTLLRAMNFLENSAYAYGQYCESSELAQLQPAERYDLREAIFNESADAIFLVDVETLLVIDCNQRTVELFEATDKAEFIGIAGHTLQRRLFAPEELDAIAAIINVEGIWSQEIEYVTRKGNYFWGNLAAKRIRVGQRMMNLVRVTDISDRKQTEAALRDSQQRLQALLHGAPQPIFIKDMQGRYVSVNPAYEQFIQLTEAELIGKTDADILPKEVADRCFITDQQALTVGHPIEFEETVPVAGNPYTLAVTKFPLYDPQGQQAGICGITIDITARHRTEAALRQSEENFRQLAENIREVFFIESADFRQLFYISPAYETIWGRSCESLYQNPQSWLEAVHPDDRQPLSQAMQQGTGIREFRIIRPDGSVRWIFTRITKVLKANGTSDRVVGLTEDITDRKLAELALQQLNQELEQRVQQRTEELLRSQETLHLQEQEIRTIVENSPDIIIRFDRDLRRLYVNKALTRFSEVSIAALLGKTTDKVQALLNYIEQFETAIRQVFATGEEQEIEVEVQLSGEQRWYKNRLIPEYDSANTIATVLMIAEDFTDRKKAEQAILQSRNSYLALLESFPALIWRSGTDGHCDYFNREWLQFTGRTPAQALGMGWLQSVHPTDRQRCLDIYQQSFMQREPMMLEYRLCRHDGQYRWVVDFGRPFQDLDGNFAGYIGSCYDISDRKQAEQTLERQIQREQLLRAISQQIRQSLNLDQILSTTVHKVRQLLQADRVVMFRLPADQIGLVIQESVVEGLPRTINLQFPVEVFPDECYAFYCNGNARIVPNAMQDEWGSCLSEFMQQIGVKSKVVVPIVQRSENTVQDQSKPALWGLLIAHSCSHYREWQPSEVDLLQQIGVQVGIAIQQANLYTQLENELAQREVLLKEIHHRVKNNLQIISALLSFQAETVQDASTLAALQDSENRLHAMALIHEILYQSEDLGRLNFSSYVRRLADSIVLANSTPAARVQLIYQLEPVFLNLETAVPCGLLLNELLTNAMKHAFKDGRSGEVQVQLQRLPDTLLPTEHSQPRSEAMPTDRYRLVVQDNGVGLPADLDISNLRSLGLRIAYDLARQLRGRLDCVRQQGTRFQLTFSELKYRKRF